MRVARLAGRLLEAVGLLRLLERAGGRSRTALWVFSWFAIYDFEMMRRVGVPWWTFRAVDLVESHLASRPGASVLEWGSGVSTLWLAERAQTVRSVEHDAGWAHEMEPHLPGHVTLVLAPPAASRTPVVTSQRRGYDGFDFAQYVASGPVAGENYDLVVIDGRAREACLQLAMAALAPGGLVVFDNVDRARYRRVVAALGNQVDVVWTRGATPSLPYPTRTALISVHAE